MSASDDTYVEDIIACPLPKRVETAGVDEHTS